MVDPGSAEPVLAYLKQHDLNLKAVLITHHHHDHIGGVAELVHQFPEIHVVGPAQEPIPTLTHPVEDGDQIELFDERFMVLGLPGHTLGISVTLVMASCFAAMCCFLQAAGEYLKARWSRCFLP